MFARTLLLIAELILTLVCLLTASVAAQPPSSYEADNGEVFYCVGHEYTDKAIHSGSWNNPRIWEDGTVPVVGDKVWIPTGKSVLLHGDWKCDSILYEGGIELLQDSHGYVSTMMGLPGSTCKAGTLDAPIECKIDWFSTPFEDGDMMQLGNGFIIIGDGLELRGVPRSERTPQETDLMVASSGHWRSTEYTYRSDVEAYPEGHHIYNFGAAIEFKHVDGDIKPHAAVVHGTANIDGLSLSGFGRTKRQYPAGPGTNQNGRYAWHFHRGGEEGLSRMRWCTVYNSDGWGFVNHSSNVVFEECYAAHVYGSGFVSEAGDEVGHLKGNVAIDCYSTDKQNQWYDEDGNRHQRDRNVERWHQGLGFSYNSPRVSSKDNVAIDCNIGFGWQCNPPDQTIAGETFREKFDDGTIPFRSQLAPQNGFEVYGYRTASLEVKWIQPLDGIEEPFTQIRLENGIRNPSGKWWQRHLSSFAIHTGYCTGATFQDVTIKGAGVGYQTIDAPAMIGQYGIEISNFVMEDVDVGFNNKRSAPANPYLLANGSIQADVAGAVITGIDRWPSSWEFDGVEVTAPVAYDYVVLERYSTIASVEEKSTITIDGVEQQPEWRLE